MAKHHQALLPPMEVNPLVPPHGCEDKTLALKRRLLRDAIDESNWKHEAVACAIGVDAPYLSKMLAGDKTITLRHFDALPDDVERLFARKYAEAMGLIACAPATGDDAVRQLVSGLVGVLTGRKAS